MNTDRFKTLDRILITNESISKMEEWANKPENKVFFDTFDFPLDEGLIVQKTEGYTREYLESSLRKMGNNYNVSSVDIDRFNKSIKDKEVHTYFRIGDGHIECYQYQYNSLNQKYDLLLGFDLDEDFHKTNKIKVVRNGISLMSDEESQKTGQHIFRLLLLTFNYINNYKEDLKVTEHKVNKVKKGKAKKRKPSKNKIVKIGVKTYSFYTDAELKELRKYNRQIESWTVRGHWRHYKDGKSVWIKPYVKGEGEIEGKEYRV